MSTNTVDDNLTAAHFLQLSAANLLSDIKHVCRTTQKTGDQLVSGINAMTDLYLDFLKEKLAAKCYIWDGHITFQQISGVLESLKGQSVFEGVGSNPQLDSYLQETSGGKKVILKQVVLTTKTVFKKGIPHIVPALFGYTVPFLAQLEQLLNCPDVLQCVLNPLPVRNGVFRTVTDGLFYKYHPVVQQHGPQTLCFYIHVDDVDPCDGLKSKAGKHNLRLFYWVLGNIHPEKRSTLKAINLMSIVKTKVAKKTGNQPFLEDFVEGMKKLGTDGVVFNVGGTLRKFYGVLLFAAADNPASANLGGFKETHSALRPCRVCMVKSSCMCENFDVPKSLLRTINEHEEHLRQVTSYNMTHRKPQAYTVNIYEETGNEIDVDEEEKDDDDDDEAMGEKYLDHKNPSINFGVNSGSALSACPGFDVTKCLPQDVLHVFAEGVVELLCRRVLKDLCIAPPKKPGHKKKVKAPLSLQAVNLVIQTKCDLGHLNVSRPSIIEVGHLKSSKLKQSGAQLMVLLHLLPFLVYEVCPREKLELVTKLIRLVNLCMSFESSSSDADKIEAKVKDFCTRFVKIYPKVRSLKLHCLAHLAMQLRLFGPLRQQGCWRFENMHSEFTDIAEVVRSKLNVPLSCASRHLSARNTQISRGKESGNYLCEGDSIISPTEVVVSALPEKNCMLEKFYDLSENSEITQVNQVSRHGHVWQRGVVFLLEKNDQHSVFGRIHNIFVREDNYIFVYNEYVTEYDLVLNAFLVKKCESQMKVTKLSELMHPFPVTRFAFNIGRKTIAYLLLQSPGGNV